MLIINIIVIVIFSVIIIGYYLSFEKNIYPYKLILLSLADLNSWNFFTKNFNIFRVKFSYKY